MPIALVTGAPEWVHHVAVALKSEGFDVVAAEEDAAPDLPPTAVMVLVAEQGSPPSRHTGPPRPWRSYLDEGPELGYTDWRDEVLCLTSAAG